MTLETATSYMSGQTKRVARRATPMTPYWLGVGMIRTELAAIIADVDGVLSHFDEKIRRHIEPNRMRTWKFQC